MAEDGQNKSRDGDAETPAVDGLSTVTPQLPPTHPKIKALLSRALSTPEALTPAEVQGMAASIVYFLLRQAGTG